MGFTSPRLVAARIAHYAAESLLRELLEVPVRGQLLSIEGKAISRLSRVPAASQDAGAAEDIEAAVRETAVIPLRLQTFRAAIGALEPQVRASSRERCESWRFGDIDFGEVRADAVRGEVKEMHLACGHVAAAVAEAERLRREALDAVSTTAAAAQGLQTNLANTTRQAAEGFQVAATALTAALAGPGLLFALWQLDVWSGPWYATVLAGVLALILLLSVWAFLRRRGPGRNLRASEALAGFSFVAVLVIAGLVAPSVSDPGDAEQTRQTVRDVREVLERGDRAQQQQLRLLRREIRRVRAELGRTSAP